MNIISQIGEACGNEQKEIIKHRKHEKSKKTIRYSIELKTTEKGVDALCKLLIKKKIFIGGLKNHATRNVVLCH